MKRYPYTPYQDPEGFIYVDNNGRNRSMRSDELYKFSDRTLTGLQTSLDDITKNIQMEYMPKRRWSTLEKKRANIMIKAIDKQLKERRMMKSLKIMRTASTAAKPCQEDSSEFYLITGSIYTDQRGTVVFPMMAVARCGRFRFIAACSYSTDIHKDIMKAQVHVSRLPLL
ncbi:hypothetical protein Tco_0811108 [Tanacetum coccineum]